MSATAEKMAYVGRCEVCAGLVAAAVDDPQSDEDRKRMADFVADLVKRGHTVERMTVQAVRDPANFGWCSCP